MHHDGRPAGPTTPGGPPDDESARAAAEARQRLVWWLLRRLCPSDLRAQSQDLAQAVLLRLLEADRARGPVRSQEYVIRTIHSVTIDELRRRARAGDARLARESADVHQDAPEHLRDLGAAVEGCLTAMAGDRRRVVFLHLQGFSSQEASVLLHMDQKRLRNLTFRGMSELRACLERRGFG
jgi:RNA polymerase sigma factor (sigma-70 family)